MNICLKFLKVAYKLFQLFSCILSNFINTSRFSVLHFYVTGMMTEDDTIAVFSEAASGWFI